MGRWRKNSPENNIKKQLVSRFHEQERITKEEAIKDYLDPQSLLATFLARRTMGAILESIRQEFAKERIPFGCVNNDNEWGIPNDEEEFRFALIKRYKDMKGRNFNTTLWVSSARRYGYLKGAIQEEKLLISKIINDYDNTS